MLTAVVRLMRPHQYTKNLFIFLPPFFAFSLADAQAFVQATMAFAAFSLVASAVYVLNDWIDREDDRLHPEKCTRPIASGQIDGPLVWLLMAVLVIAGSALMLAVSAQALGVALAYLLLNVAYSLKLKHVPVIDVTLISTGFVLRLFVGAFATGVALSHWIIVMTFLLALFLALAKRRDDVLIYLNTEQKMRRAIDGYNLKFLDSAMMMSASIVIVAYILWSISPEVVTRIGSENLYLTSLFVVLGVMRYMQIAFVEEMSGNPSRIVLRDRFIQLVLLGWLGSFAWLLYFS